MSNPIGPAPAIDLTSAKAGDPIPTGVGLRLVEIAGVLNGTTDGTTFTPVGTSGFGADTLVKLPNASTTLVNALELVTALTTSTAGSEVSSFTASVLVAGAQVAAFVATGNAFLGPLGTIALPGFSFQGHASTGVSYDVGTGGLFLSVAGVQQIGFLGSGHAVMTTDAAFFGLGSLAQGFFGMSGLNAQVNSNLGDTTIGGVRSGAALAQNAVLGFIDFPLITVSAAGAPTGTPTKVPAGMGALMGMDTTNKKLWFWDGAAVRFITYT